MEKWQHMISCNTPHIQAQHTTPAFYSDSVYNHYLKYPNHHNLWIVFRFPSEC